MNDAEQENSPINGPFNYSEAGGEKLMEEEAYRYRQHQQP